MKDCRKHYVPRICGSCPKLRGCRFLLELQELVIDMWHEMNYTSVHAEDGTNHCLDKMAELEERMDSLGVFDDYVDERLERLGLFDDEEDECRAGGYTGGFNNETIPDSYTYEDFERDMEVCEPLFALEDAGLDSEENMLPLFCDEKFVAALGRVTAYIERNEPRESDISFEGGLSDE